MDGHDTAQLIYLGILLGAGVFWFVAQRRIGLNKILQYIAIWGFIFVGVIAAYGLWDDIRGTIQPQHAVHQENGQINVPRARDGHYYLTLQVNDTPITFLVDTGATQMVLTQQDASQIGLKPDTLPYHGRAQTANGEVRTARVTLDSIDIGQVRDTNVIAYVNQGELQNSLLGMGYLQRWQSIEIRNNELILTR
ncbi:retropepsin-like aspartic protease family protein [Epibacterium ulvae]|uniref:retropepsin-like aspartic protease family protein n=1 Tax=Epibacterium ulvae TaxID=1156985 RepID=UPI002490BBB2|nr:TIGR02281 family clan AA aspartic protease [Epibacterium ulvae]